jgi:hypothetical protein
MAFFQAVIAKGDFLINSHRSTFGHFIWLRFVFYYWDFFSFWPNIINFIHNF